MSINKADIQQIQKYLNGELDAKAMHTLERQAQDDPFLMDALEGYQHIGKDQQANLTDIRSRFEKHTTQSKPQVILWRVLPIAASLLLALAVGFWINAKNQTHQLAAKTTVSTKRAMDMAVAIKSATPNKPNLPAKPGINGIITDPTGHALTGVRVTIKGTKLHALTDATGTFNLPAPPATKGILNVAYAGYNTRHVKLNGKDSLKVMLTESANAMAGVSVTAYVEDDKPVNKTHPLDGWRAFREYLQKNAFVAGGATGLVKLAFTVSMDGNINGIRVIRGNNEAMNQRAIELVLNGPAWKGIDETKEMRLKIRFRKQKDS